MGYSAQQGQIQPDIIGKAFDGEVEQKMNKIHQGNRFETLLTKILSC